MKNTINIAGYKFICLDNLQALQESFEEKCHQLNLKGSILLSPEGINLYLAGLPENVGVFLLFLAEDDRFADISFRKSVSANQPFRRLLVKIKDEIIVFDVDGIEPEKKTAPHLSPQQLKQWLDEGKDVVLLDTRNEFEMKFGTFDDAVGLGIEHFRQFPNAVERLDERYKDKPVVTFCTGGIRCEKASALMLKRGFKHVYQLQGGILNYLSENGSAHYHGECFVFDHRFSLDEQLQETGTVQCRVCFGPVSKQDQQTPEYIDGVSCPTCV